jgi:hypothetical protein
MDSLAPENFKNTVSAEIYHRLNIKDISVLTHHDACLARGRGTESANCLLLIPIPTIDQSRLENSLLSRACICRSFKKPRNRFPACRAGKTTLFDVPARVSTEFRRHGIPSGFFTSVYSVFRAELAKIPPEFRCIPCHIIP